MHKPTDDLQAVLARLVRVAFGAAGTLCGVSFLYVAWQAFYNTAWLVSEEATGFFRSDIGFQTVLGLLACGALWVAVHCAHKWQLERFVLPAVLLCTFVAGAVWLWAAGASPAWEPWVCGRVAETAMQQDWYLFRPGEYLSLFPFQSGFVAYLELIYTLFGARTDVAVSCLGLLWVMAGQVALYGLAGRISPHPRAKTITALLLVAAWPWVLYVTFNYGTFPSLSAALCGALALLRFLDAPRVRRFIPVVAWFTVAMLLKNAAMIPLIAACLVLVLFCVQHGRWRLLVCVPVLCAAVYGAPIAAQAWYEVRSEQTFTGTPLLVWFAMGLEEGDMMAPGWFNGKTYNALRDAEMDPKLCTQQQKEDIAARVELFANDPAYTKSFFMRKLNSMWLDPSFGAFYFSLASEPHSGEKLPALTSYARTRTQDSLVMHAADALQTLVYAAAVLGLLSLCHKGNAQNALLAIMALGGFLYLVVSEGKSQYAFTYYVLLLPYAAHGLCVAWHAAGAVRDKLWRSAFPAQCAQEKASVAKNTVAPMD